MKTALHRFVRMIDERVISELLAFWHAGVYRLKGLFTKPTPTIADHQTQALTIFVHGYLGDSTCWLPWIKYFTRRGHTVTAIDLGLDHPLQSIDELADRLAIFVRKSLSKYGKNPPEIRLVGHSLGGVIAATYALREPEGVHVSDVISLAAPLKGAKLACAAKWVLSKCGADMEPGSQHLKKLQGLFKTKTGNTHFHYAAAKHDDVVAIDHTTFGETAEIFACNHMGIIYEESARDWVETVLEK